jgi:hypothetical protein
MTGDRKGEGKREKGEGRRAKGEEKRLAAHSVYWGSADVFKLHYIELDENQLITCIEPLENEIASTSFYNGILFVFPTGTFASVAELKERIQNIRQQFSSISVSELFQKLQTEEIKRGEPVQIFHLDGIDLLSAKFRTSDGCGDCYIQRLC